MPDPNPAAPDAELTGAFRDALVDLMNALSAELAHEIEHSPGVGAAWDRAALLVEQTTPGVGP